jgi:predicted MFS family arabinose efflux permease
VLRNRPFLGVLGINAAFIFAGFSGFEVLPPYAKNEAGLSETTIGVLFLVNTLVIVVAQLPVAKLVEGRRRMRVFALLGLVWALAWVIVPVGGGLGATAAAAVLAGSMAVFAIGECLHGAVQAPLVADLADPLLLGRYMALSALSWQVGFALGPAAGGFGLELSPTGVWVAAAGVCLANGLVALALEPRLPLGARRTPASA